MKKLSSSITIVTFLFAGSANAEGWRSMSSVPGISGRAKPVKGVGSRLARNKRVEAGIDFNSGKVAKVGGSTKTYIGDNVPLLGDFDGDGRDDVAVRWVSGPHAGQWYWSRNTGKDAFAGGKQFKFGNSPVAYQGDNTAFAADFNGDGFDDIGVHWNSGPHQGKWTISFNDKSGNFKAGKEVLVGGASTSYVGDNDPVVGDFNGDGLADLGVRWKSGKHRGQWTISRNQKRGFASGTPARFGGKTRAFEGDNEVLVADFNGDGFDDVAVRWTGSGHNGKWTISLNDATGSWSFAPGHVSSFAGTSKPRRAYQGPNVALAGDVSGDGFADFGVHWTKGTHEGKWTFSKNRRRARITDTYRIEVRIPVLFLNFKGGPAVTDAKAQALFAEVEDYFERTSHGLLDIEFRYEVVDLQQSIDWRAGVPLPNYGADGSLLNANAFPAAVNYGGYACRFPLPGGGKSIVFNDSNGSKEFVNNPNIHRNYCQVVERNYTRDALQQLATDAPEAFDSLMSWSSSTDDGPTVFVVSDSFTAAGMRNFNSTWGGQTWPFTVRDRSFTDYGFSKVTARPLSHELGHFIGHDQELYETLGGNRCKANRTIGYLGAYDIMGNQNNYYASLSAFNRWRFGFAKARHLTPADGTVDVSIPLAMTGDDSRTVVAIQPDPKGHPDEFFLIENRGPVTSAGKTFDAVDKPGMFIYHINANAPTTASPLIELVNDTSKCPSTLVPRQGDVDPGSSSAVRFHDGSIAKFSLSGVQTQGTKLTFEVSFTP